MKRLKSSHSKIRVKIVRKKMRIIRLERSRFYKKEFKEKYKD